ncbi:Serine acetyltransferase [compost metagenome]
MVLQEVPANCTVVGNPGRVVRRDGMKVNKLNHADMPDPSSELFRSLQAQIDELKRELERERRKTGEHDYTEERY